MERNEEDPLPNNDSGLAELGFSISSPSLDLPCEKNQETPDFIKSSCRRAHIAPVELFSEIRFDSMETGSGSISAIEDEEPSEMVSEVRDGSLSMNAGDIDSSIICGSFDFQRDKAEMDQEVLDMGKCSECRKLKEQYDLLFKEELEVKRSLEDVKRVSELKTRECREAWSKLHELQMELMRKSMHVGSLAFAVEGQVKEKSRWFLSLEELSKKFEMLKIEHGKLSQEALGYRRCIADMTQMTSTIQSTLNYHAHLERQYKDLKCKYAKEAVERKDLYNKVIEMKGNIRVFCRCRPLNSDEIAAGAIMAVDFESVKDGELTIKSSHGAFKKVFKFDSVFSPEDNQERVFEKTSPLAVSVLDGYNVCIFAYGQTGTGKTFTMEGTEEARGVNYRTLEELFRVIRERQGLFKYEITVSVLEVYNEQIHDLLLSGTQPGMAAKRLEVRQVAEGVHHVPGLVEAHVSNMNEVWEVLQMGSKARAVSSTNANEHSSRSHCIHCVIVKGENLLNGEFTSSKLWLVDLSGSERVAKTDAEGERLKEAQNINKSLSALGDVISALGTKSPHIPFRNSKLTHLLQDSLGGDSKTLMFVQISPNDNDVGETLCSLNFASRVRGIELGPAKKQVDGYRHMVEKAKNDIKNKDGHIKKMEEIIYSLELKNKAKDLINKNLNDKVKELESQLLIERKLARQHVDTKIAENQEHLKHKHKQQQELQNTPCFTPITHKEIGSAIARPFAESNILTEKNFRKPIPLPLPDNTTILRNLPFQMDKENKPELAEERFTRNPPEIPIFPATRRESLIPFSRKANALASRCDSLIPFPAERAAADVTPLPISNLLIDIKKSSEIEDENKSKNHERSSNKLKKANIRSPLPQTVKRRTLAGLENVRVSIGGSGRGARRLAVRDGSKTGERGVQQKWKDKERGWNQRTAVR